MRESAATPYTVPSRPLFWDVVRGYRRTLMAGALCGLVIGLGAAMTRKATYTSTATLMFPAAPASRLAMLGGGGGDIPSMPLLDGALVVPQVGSSVGTATMLVQSRRIQQETIAELRLKERWGLRDDRAVIQRFQDSLQCKTGKNGELCVGFKDESGALATEVAAVVVKKLDALSRELGVDPANRGVAFLQDQVTTAEKEVASAQAAMLAFQEKNQVVSLPEQARSLADQYAKLQQDLTAAQLEADTALQQAKLLQANAQHLIEACVDPAPDTRSNLGPLYQKATTAESELALMRARLTDDHPDVQEKLRALTEAKRLLQNEIQRQLAILKSGSSPASSMAIVQAASSRARVSGLQAAVADIQRQVARLPQLQATYARLTAEVEADTAALALFRQELEKARIIVQSRGSFFVIVDPAERPLAPDPRGRAKIVVLALLLGLGVASLFPYREWERRQRAYEEALWLGNLNGAAHHPTEV